MHAEKSHSLKAWNNSDSPLLMLLSLNLLLLVFFMLLNSMASAGRDRPHSDKLAQVQPQSAATMGVVAEGREAPLSPYVAWYERTLTILRGTIMNRIDLDVLPMNANADRLEMTLPLDRVFDASGRLRRADLVRDIAQMAGAGTSIAWELQGPARDALPIAAQMNALVQEAGRVMFVEGDVALLRIRLRPGMTTDAGLGVKAQALGAQMGGNVKGVDGE